MLKEKDTRIEIINQRLLQAGWMIDDLTQVRQEFSITLNEPKQPYGKPKKEAADYILLDKRQKSIAVIEAKQLSIDARLGEEQAKQYAQHIQEEFGGDLPFCFYTNGYDIWFWDIGNYPPRKVQGFPTRADLERMNVLRQRKILLSEVLINTDIAGRPYQIQAIRSVMEGIEANRRKFLLVMATGTGKTRTTLAMIQALSKANRVQRVLFLVDRIELQNQATDAIKEHLPNYSYFPTDEDDSVDISRRIYVFTYPSLLNIIQSEQNPFSSHFFDLVIVDESHRSIYNVYQGILNYFDALILGLTATPTDVIDHNTFQLFDCEDGLPNFAYSYKQAVDDQFLCDYDVLRIRTKFQEQGIHIGSVSLEDQKKLLVEGKPIEEITFEGTDLERIVTNKGTNTLIFREFMDASTKDSFGVIPGKSIFFCMNIAHAQRMKEIIDELHPEYNGELAKVIVSNDSRVYGKGGLLHQFKKQNMPRIAISVGMLDTGVDIPEVVNLVFAKPVFSYTRFWQMIGRGTRLLSKEKKIAYCTEKERFLIMDCWDNFEYFKVEENGREIKTGIALPTRFFILRLDKLVLAQKENLTNIIANEKEALKSLIKKLPQNTIIVKEAQQYFDEVNTDDFWNNLIEDDFVILRHRIAPLMRSLSDIDFTAMRFEKDCVEASFALLAKNTPVFEALKGKIINELQQIPSGIEVVKPIFPLIQKAMSITFWNNVSDADLLNLGEQVAPFIQYKREQGEAEMVILALRDEITKREMITFGPDRETVSITRYKEMIEERIKALAMHNLILQKIKKDDPISNAEVQYLAELLEAQNPYITESIMRKVFDNKRATFISFIKHVLGLENLETYTSEVNKAFQSYINNHNNMSSKQLEFLELLKKYIIERGKVSRKDLVQAPFTNVHQHGILGIFAPNQIAEILQLSEALAA